MQHNNRVKLLSGLAGILLFNGFIPNYAYADNPNNSGSAANGSKVWADNCARCHNYRAPTEFSAKQSRVIMDHMRVQAGLTGQEARDAYAFLAAQSPNTQAASATHAENKPIENTAPIALTSTTMSPKNTAAATKNKAKPQDTNTEAQSGNAIYKQTCVSCHGANGKGAIPGVPDFTSKNGPLSKTDSTLLQHTIKGFQSPGSSMAMPARGGNSKLTNTDLQNTLTYIRQNFR